MIGRYIRSFAASPLAAWAEAKPWELTVASGTVVTAVMAGLAADGFRIADGIAVHRSAVIETGAIVKSPAVIGPDCFLAAGAYLRNGVWLDRACVIGPGSEVKSSLVFAGSKLAHFNFVGDSIIGSDVNLEAGSIVANYRNERQDRQIHCRLDGQRVATGTDKFGALIGDHVRIGANAVIAPGALIEPGQIVRRLALLDQDSEA